MRGRTRVIALVAVAMGAWTLASLWRVGLRIEGPPAKVRYAFVLDGQGPNGVRVRHALELLHSGRVDTVVVSGSPVGIDVHYSTVWIHDLELDSAERSRIVELRSRSMSTQDEARLADSVFAALGQDSVVVVTSDFHAWRAASVFRTVTRGRVAYGWSPATDPFWAMGLFDRGAAKMRAEEWTKRLTWTLVESWLARKDPVPVAKMVRGSEVGRFPPPHRR
ncbi:MAG TPA: YdcF family protein [Fibrobacteria bacterium]|nr:YdcF family protein [Fibrobacteria bacterium]